MLLHVKALSNVVRVILLSLLSTAALTTVAFWVASYPMSWPPRSGFERRLADDVEVQGWGGCYRAVVRSGPLKCSGVSVAAYAGRLWLRVSRRVPYPSGAKERYITLLGHGYARRFRRAGTINLHWGEIWDPWPPSARQVRWLRSTRELDTVVVLPLWLPFAALSAWPAFTSARWFWRRRHWPCTGYCRRCGYDLRGLPELRCPECGEPFGPPLASDCTS